MAVKEIRRGYWIADSKTDLSLIKEKELGLSCYVIEDSCDYKMKSTGEWVKQVLPAANSSSSSESNDEVIVAEPCMFKMPYIEGDGSSWGIYLDSGSLYEAMLEKGLGMYNIYINENVVDAPEEMITNKASGRGLCCIDTFRTEENGNKYFYGWVIVFDKKGNAYYNYSTYTGFIGWKKMGGV